VKVSATLRKDPTSTKRLVKSYEDELVGIFERTRKELVFALESSKQLEQAAKLDVSQVKDKASDALNAALKQATAKAQIQVPKVKKLAQVRVDILLKSIGITPSAGTSPADATFENLLLERNIGSLKGLTDSIGKDVTRELTDGMAKGEGIEKLAKRIGSVADIGIERARTIARTETLYAFNASAVERYKRHGVERVEWLTAHDDRLCDNCLPLDGEKFDIGDAPDCPLHPNCRCTLLPVAPEEV
jgi:SPP1 gp7 family putative phage head morphogenesis protein